MAEGHRCWFAAVFAADAEFDVRADFLGKLHADLHEFADAALVDGLEGIAGQDFLFHIGLEELVRVVAGEAEGHLGQVVGSEREELGFFGNQV